MASHSVYEVSKDEKFLLESKVTLHTNRAISIIYLVNCDIDPGRPPVVHEFDVNEPWRIEVWEISGVHSGYRIVRGGGAKLVIVAGFLGDMYMPGSFGVAKSKAEALLEFVNREIA